MNYDTLVLTSQNGVNWGRVVTTTDVVKIEKWLFMILIAVLGFMCSRELSRLSTSIESLAESQTKQMVFYHDLRLELKEFKAEVRGNLKELNK